MSKEDKKQLNIHVPQELLGGNFANNLIVAHTKDEFVMDFLMNIAPQPSLTSRVIVSPSHMKRVLAALQDNIKKYEEKFGEIKTEPVDESTPIGFRH